MNTVDTEKYAALVAVKNAARREKLNNREARAVEMAKLYFDENLSYTVIGKRFGLTRQRVCQIINSLSA